MPLHLPHAPLPPAICIMYAILSVQQQQRWESCQLVPNVLCAAFWGRVGATVVIAVVIVVADAQV